MAGAIPSLPQFQHKADHGDNDNDNNDDSDNTGPTCQNARYNEMNAQ